MSKKNLVNVVSLTALLLVTTSCGNDPYCPKGTSWCWAKCIDVSSDDDNCGSCENKCGPHSFCVNGECTCMAGYTDCNGTCANLNFDAANCGICGNACPLGESCLNGICFSPDPNGCERYGLTTCDNMCVDTNSDEAHCGSCNSPCRPDQVCNNGTCICFGSMAECNDQCVDLATDPRNCGVCGNDCIALGCVMCTGGICWVGGCHAPMIECECNCVNPNTSNLHCGMCDNACDTGNGFICRDGVCECLFGEECVAGVCSNLDTDEANCGACGNACRDNQVCNEGGCECFVGMTECGNPPVCVDLLRDPDHCGTCGNRCPSGGYCVNGTCDNGCRPPWVLCGSDCVDLQTSNRHCGQCDNPCVVANGFICQDGICDCTGITTDCSGVCVNLGSDEQNCGRCGNVCWADGTCLGGTCLGDPSYHIELTCPESEMPHGASMQCIVRMHFIGGSPSPIDVTDDVNTTWGWAECDTPQCISDNDVIADIDEGQVTTVPEGLGTLGDMASIMATYSGLYSNQWTITLTRDYLCDVKIVPEHYDFEDWGKAQDFALPYLATGPGSGITWELIPVGIYRTDNLCTVGGPYLRELTAGGNWTVAPTGDLTLIAAGANRTHAEVVYKATYPTADQTVLVDYSRSGVPDDNDVNDTMDLTIVALTDTNWSLQAMPAWLTIPDGQKDGVQVMMNFGGNTLNVTNFGNESWMVPPIITDTSDPIMVTEDGYHSGGTFEGLYVFNASEGPGSTIVEWEMVDTQSTPHAEIVNIPIDVTDAVPVECFIYLDMPPPDPDILAVPEIYPTRHPDVQYKVYACMSDIGTGCIFDDMRDITDENWGNGWQIVYAGTAGALGTVDAFGSATPGLHHIPMFAPTNPNPENGEIRYQFGPDVGDGCQVEVRVRQRYLCAVDVSSIPDLAPGEVKTTRRLWYPRAPGAGDDEVLLTNIDGVTQQFFAYAVYGYLLGMNCASNPGGFINGYRLPLAMSDIGQWEYEDNGQHTEPIFGAGGINITTGVGTVTASTTELNRLADVTIHVHLAPHDCDPVAGCTDSVVVNACGKLPATPDRRLASSFSEIDGFEEQTVQISVGDTTTRVYGISKYESPPGGCFAVEGVDTEYYLDESHQTNVEFFSQSSAIASIGDDGGISANSQGQTILEVTWDDGPVEDTLPIEVLPFQ